MIRRDIEELKYVGSLEWSAKLVCGHKVSFIAKTRKTPYTAECKQCEQVRK